MPKRTDKLVHEMPLSHTVRFKLYRIGVDYDSDTETSTFKYQLVNWKSKDKSPILTVAIKDWEDDGKSPKRNTLKATVETELDTKIMDALIEQLYKS